MFFIVWGKKLVYRTLGYVADFCPMCRTPRIFKLRRVGVARHVYYVSFGEGELAGYQRTCEECGISLDAKATIYASVADKPAPLPQLITQTFPNLAQAYQPTLALEERVRNSLSSLTPEERRVLIRNPMLLLSPRVEKRFASTHMDADVGYTILALVAALFGGSYVLKRLFPDSLEMSMLAILVVGMIIVVWQISQAGKRYMRSQIVPVLATALRPLKPTEGEVTAALEELKKLRHKIGSKLKVNELMEALAQNGLGDMQTATSFG
jgi:hypothetical protein